MKFLKKLWKIICQGAVFVFAFVKKAVVWIEDAITDTKGRMDIRVILGITGSVEIFGLAGRVPSLILSGKVLDLVAYGVILSLLIGFVLALFGISKSSLEPGADSGPASSIVSEIKDAIAKVQ